MPRYDYRCEAGHVRESVQGMGVESIPCPVCGAEARRVAVYQEQYISGETVARGRPPCRQEALDKRGRYRLDRLREAHETVLHDYQREGHAAPDLAGAGIRRAENLKRRGVKSLTPETAMREPPENAMRPRARPRKAS